MIYSLTTERQSVIYWAKITCEQDSISILTHKKMMKRQVYSSEDAIFTPLHEKKSCLNFDCSGGEGGGRGIEFHKEEGYMSLH